MMNRQVAIGMVCGLLFGASPAFAQGDAFIEYEVKKGDTCIKIAKKVYGDGDLCYALMAGSNDFDKKFRIYPGQKLKLPTKEQIAQQRKDETSALPEKSDGPDAQLKAFRGEVTARSPEASDWEKASRNKELWRRWKVNSASRASAEVFFVREKATLRMRENTLVVIYGKGAEESAPGTSRHAVLEKGALATRLGELSGASSAVASMEIETPGAVVTSSGGDALVSVVAGDTTLVANHTSASTAVRGNRKSSKPVSLPKNTGSKVEKGKEPTPPKPLPAPPQWDSPSFDAVAMGGKSRVRASWEDVKDAAVWRVEVWRAAEKELMDVAVLDAKIREVVFEDFAPGDYELRIATIDADGFEGIMSEPVALTVKELLASTDAEPDTQARHARRELYLGERLAVTSGLECAFGGRKVVNHTLQTYHTGTHVFSCVDEKGRRLPDQEFIVAPNGAKMVKKLPDMLPLNAVEELRLFLDHPIEKIDLSFSEGFAQGGPVTLDEEGAWVIPVKAVEPSRQGELRIGTPGILGATLIKVPLASAAEEVSAEELEPEKPWHVHVGAYASNRDLTNVDVLVGGASYNQGLRFGLRAGAQWRRHLVLDAEFDTGAYNGLIPGGDAQVFGFAGGLSYRFGPWALKPFLRVGGGIDLIPDLSAQVAQVFGGGGLAWVIERRAEIRLDVQQMLLFDETPSPGAMMPSVTLGFAATF